MATSSKSGGTVKGINVDGIAKIKTALTEYTERIANSNDLDIEITKIEQAIKGSETEAEITAMMKKSEKVLIIT